MSEQKLLLVAAMQELKKRSGLNQTEFSKALGKPQPYISNVLNGHAAFSFAFVQSCAAKLGYKITNKIYIETL